MAAREKVVEIKNFKMEFGDNTVIEDLSFDVYRGEIFGFLGSNGSGKTTTLRALLNLYDATAGELLIDGKPYTVSRGVHLGYLPEERGLYKKEKVIDTMVYFGELKGMATKDAKEFSLKFLERVGLGDKANAELGKLSGGQQQKVQLGVTVMNSPELLILDEPTKGLDPVNRRLLMNIVKERHDAGATIILVTHQMEEVEKLCDRVILLKDGKSVAYGELADVKKQFDGSSLDDIFVKVYGGENEEDLRDE